MDNYFLGFSFLETYLSYVNKISITVKYFQPLVFLTVKGHISCEISTTKRSLEWLKDSLDLGVYILPFILRTSKRTEVSGRPKKVI